MSSVFLKFPPNSRKKLTSFFRRHCFILVTVYLVVFIICWRYVARNDDEEYELGPSGKLILQSWPRFLPPPLFNGQEWKIDSCFISRQTHSLINLLDRVKEWRESEDLFCKELGEKFHAIYSMDVRHGQVKISAEFGGEITKWLGKGPDALNKVKNQVILHIFNRYTGQHTIHTQLRAKRPLGRRSKDSKSFLNGMIEDTKRDCDFCQYKRKTAEDVFGRLESRYAVTAANVFKMDHWHGLVILRDHNFFNLTMDAVLDMFNLTMRWLQTAHGIDSEYKYPSICWDMLPRAGASQVHPHLQVFLDPKRYYGRMETFRRAAQLYVRDFPNANLFSDTVAIHSAAGLSVRLGDAVAIVELVGNKDHEVAIMSAEFSDNVFKLLYLVIKLYSEKYHLYSFSSVMIFPTMGDVNDGQGNMPVIVRISPRGNPDDVVSDMSSFELYLVNNVNIDPYEVMDALTAVVKKYINSRGEM